MSETVCWPGLAVGTTVHVVPAIAPGAEATRATSATKLADRFRSDRPLMGLPCCACGCRTVRWDYVRPAGRDSALLLEQGSGVVGDVPVGLSWRPDVALVALALRDLDVGELLGDVR